MADLLLLIDINLSFGNDWAAGPVRGGYFSRL